MSRFFIEVAYRGTSYAGFQRQHNANTIQAEVESALNTYFRSSFSLTGSSRTDAGVHARQNFFHFDYDNFNSENDFTKAIYHLNAILPLDVVIKSIAKVKDEAHCRFDALSRTYQYKVYQVKDPFLQDSGFYYPFTLDQAQLQVLADELLLHQDFESFAKRNSQVFTYNCYIVESRWLLYPDCMIYQVTANRFLRGMVKGLVGTMLHTVTKKHTLEAFRQIITVKDASKANFAVPSHALTLMQVLY
jgi:tRNA pseudouridine38-40 synthase